MSRHINKKRTNYSEAESIGKGPGGPGDTRLKDEEGKFTAGEVLAPGSMSLGEANFGDGKKLSMRAQNESEGKKIPNIKKSKENEFDDAITTPSAFSALIAVAASRIMNDEYDISESDSVSLMRSNEFYDKSRGVDFFLIKESADGAKEILDTFDVKLADLMSDTFPFNLFKSYKDGRTIKASGLNQKAAKQLFVTPIYQKGFRKENALAARKEEGKRLSEIVRVADIAEMDSKKLSAHLNSLIGSSILKDGRSVREACEAFAAAKDEASEREAAGIEPRIFGNGDRSYLMRNPSGMPYGTNVTMAYYADSGERSVRIYLPKKHIIEKVSAKVRYDCDIFDIQGI